MASRDAGPPGSPRRLEIGLASPADAVDGTQVSTGSSGRARHASGDHSGGESPARAVPEIVYAVTQSGHPMSAPAPSLVEGVEIELELEEVAVCELCGLVVREPAPPACPACGGGFG